MRFLGIDYGAKKVGIAVSDESNIFALPLCTLKNDSSLIENIKDIIKEKEISDIVIGESIDFKGKENPIMKDIYRFRGKIEAEINLPVHFEPEHMTSEEARLLQEDRKIVDESAAALILQGYLDKLQNKNKF